MHGTFKVIFIVLCCAICSHCRPLPPQYPGELKRRGLDVGITVNFPTTQKYDDSYKKKLESVLAYELANLVEEQKDNNIQDCPNCGEEVIVKRSIKPAYRCDEWDPKHRVCILERNIGGTVTFYLSTGKDEGNQKFNITWKKEFHMRDSAERKEFTIDPQNPPENIIVGRRGFELRVSPITESDMEYNMFSATLHTHSNFKSKLYFMLRIVAVDLGFVYVGETVELHLRKVVSLPEEAMSFKWYMEKDGERGTLPSNMKVSITGSSIKIYELRQEQEGILACSVYTNLNVLATKKRFLIKELSKNKDVLQSSPNHSLVFREEFRLKRDPKKLLPYLSSLRHSRQKRARLAVEEVERALFLSTTAKKIPTYPTVQSRSSDYDPYIESIQDYTVPYTESIPKNRFQVISDDFEDVAKVPEDKEVGRFMNQYQTAVERGQSILDRPQPINKDLTIQVGLPRGQMNTPDNRPIMNQPDYRQMNAPDNRPIMNRPDYRQMNAPDNRPIMNQPDYRQMNAPDDRPSMNQPDYKQINKPESGFVGKPRPYLANKAPLKNVPQSKKQNGPLLDISVNPPKMQQKPKPTSQKQGMQYVDLDVQVKGRKKQKQQEDIIVNFGESQETLKTTTAEIQIAKLISTCLSDFECSVEATCVRSSLKSPGFCKCLPGANGVGIFCREEVWLSNSNFEIEEHNLDYMAFPDNSPQG